MHINSFKHVHKQQSAQLTKTVNNHHVYSNINNNRINTQNSCFQNQDTAAIHNDFMSYKMF